MLKRFRVDGYKSLSGIDVSLGDLTVVVGPNAAGKSNLLDAIYLLGRLGTTQTLNEAFAGHRGTPLEAFAVGEGGTASLIAKKWAKFTLSADVYLEDAVVEAVEADIARMREGLPEKDVNRPSARKRITERNLRYEVAVEIRTDTGLLRVADERISALRVDGEVRESRRPYLEKMEHRLHLRMEGQSHPNYYDLGLDHTLLSRPLYPPHYPHMTALREELKRWRIYYFDPEQLRSESPLREATTLTPRGGDLAAYVNTLKANDPKRYRSLVQALKFIIPAVEGVDVLTTAEGMLTLSVIENGVPFSARVASEGTLRVIGLLAITGADTPTSLVGYEEPENGVHPRRLELIAEVLRNSASRKHVQLLVNTHSPVLPGLMSDATLYECRRDNGTTRFRGLTAGLFARSEAEQALDESDYQRRAMTGAFGG